MSIPRNSKIRGWLWTPGFIGNNYTTPSFTLPFIGDPRSGVPVPLWGIIRDKCGNLTWHEYADEPGYRQKEQPQQSAYPFNDTWWQTVIKFNPVK